jgi:hypothetical protein
MEDSNRAEVLEQALGRYRNKLVSIRDDMDAVSYTIRGIELDLETIQKEDKEANETDA